MWTDLSVLNPDLKLEGAGRQGTCQGAKNDRQDANLQVSCVAETDIDQHQNNDMIPSLRSLELNKVSSANKLNTDEKLQASLWYLNDLEFSLNCEQIL